MTYVLTNEEKTAIIEQHLRTLEYSKYNTTISLMEENAVSSPSTSTLSTLNEQLTTVNAKISALATELDSL